jgi:nicotinate-nucleotide adenylyltransferase
LNKVIGILGGTFDPPHWGHIRLAEHFSRVLVLDELIWLPSGEPWQKGAHITPAKDRLAMTMAAADVLREEFLTKQISTVVTVDPMEIDRGGSSYTIDSAKELRQQFGPNVSLIWLMGADSFLQLYTWNDWRDLSRYIHLAVASRPPYSIQKQLTDHPPLQDYYLDHQTQSASDLCAKAAGLIYLDEQLSIDLASSSLRPLLSSNNTANPIQEWLPKSIHALILKKGLYQSTG